MNSKTLKKIRDSFIDEVVVFYLKDMSIAALTDNGENMRVSGMTDGYVIDIDETYYYLGNEDGEITKVINHDVISMVEIGQTEEIFNYPVPNENEDIH